MNAFSGDLSNVSLSPVQISISSPDGRSRVHGKLHLHENTMDELYVFNGYLGVDREVLKTFFRYEPNVLWHSNEIVEIEVGTGSPGRYSKFYDLRNDTISTEIWFVIAYDVSRSIAAVGEERLLITKVFQVDKPGAYNSNNSVELKRDFKPTAILWLIIRSGRFDSEGNFLFEYQNNKGTWVKSAVHADEIDF